jgi:thiamine biosynthesis lipoprotein
VVTSGNYRKFYIKDGKKYAHTIDPRSGRPVEHDLLSATVIASTATEADALATFFMVIGFDEARSWVEGHDGIEACLIASERSWTSPGF